MKIGFALSSEEFAPGELVKQAVLAEQAGFEGLSISDHFHPWNDEQGHSPFVWSVIGAIAEATDSMDVITAVTCPTVRIHPAILAQAAATSAVLLEDGGRKFRFGLGSGEALNEHIFAEHWPEADIRLEALDEAIGVIRQLWQGGDQSHYGKHYTLENARIYDLPLEPPEIWISGFGPKSTELAAKIGDGYVSAGPDDKLADVFKSNGGAGKPMMAGAKVCWAPTAKEGRETIHRLWPSSGLPGELAQILPTPAHFEQASQIVTEEQAVGSKPVGNDVATHLESLKKFADAGYDHVYVQQVGSAHHEEFFEAYAKEVLPAAKQF